MAQPPALFTTLVLPEAFLSSSSFCPVPAIMVATAFAITAVFVRLSWSAELLVTHIVCHHHRFRSHCRRLQSFPSFRFTSLWSVAPRQILPYGYHFNRIAAISFLHICSTSGYVPSFSFPLPSSFLFTSQSQGIFLQLDNLYIFQFPFSIYIIILISINIVRVFCFGHFLPYIYWAIVRALANVVLPDKDRQLPFFISRFPFLISGHMPC